MVPSPLHWSLIHLSYQKKTTCEINCKHGVVHQQNTENQICIPLHFTSDQWCKVRTKSLFCIMPEHNIILRININVKPRSVIAKQFSVYKCTDRKTTYSVD